MGDGSSKQAAGRAIAGTWALVAVEDGQQWDAELIARRAGLRLNVDGSMFAHDGCNDRTGRYESSSAGVEFRWETSTWMGTGPDDRLPGVFNRLEAAVRLSLSTDSSLTLSVRDLTLRFVPGRLDVVGRIIPA